MCIQTRALGGILIVTLDRPQAMNAIDAGMNEALERVWDAFEVDDGLHVAILTGAGEKAFCAGADLKSLLPPFQQEVRCGGAPQWTLGGGLARGRTFTKPLIAAINGHALAGGLELALACDIRLCSTHATFSMAEVRWAVVPAGGGTQRLPRSVPLGLAMQMLLTGTAIDADTALRSGLVNSVVAPARLMEEAVALAERIADGGPLAVRAIKRLVYEGLDGPLHEGMSSEHAAFIDILQTEDAAEGHQAFAQRRTPVYRGS